MPKFRTIASVHGGFDIKDKQHSRLRSSTKSMDWINSWRHRRRNLSYSNSRKSNLNIRQSHPTLCVLWGALTIFCYHNSINQFYKLYRKFFTFSHLWYSVMSNRISRPWKLWPLLVWGQWLPYIWSRFLRCIKWFLLRIVCPASRYCLKRNRWLEPHSWKVNKFLRENVLQVYLRTLQTIEKPWWKRPPIQ